MRWNPKAQVPLWADETATVFDSTHIFEYWEEAYPQSPLRPASLGARTQARQFELLADELLFTPVAVLIGATRGRTDVDRTAELLRFAQSLDLFRQQISGRDYIAGAV